MEDSKYPQVSALPERRVKKRKRTALWDMVTRKEAQSLCFLCVSARESIAMEFRSRLPGRRAEFQVAQKALDGERRSLAVPERNADSAAGGNLQGVVHTGLAFFWFFSSVRDLPAQTVATFSYIDPATAILFSALLLRERLDMAQALGACLILGAALAGELPLKRPFLPDARPAARRTAEH